MNEHFLTDIEIKQFKCFTDFKASGFKRVNLIGGKNNIGKTALMEAIYINTSSVNINSMITAIAGVKYKREKANLIFRKNDSKENLDATKQYSSISNLNTREFYINDDDAKKQYNFVIYGITKTINARDLTIIPKHISNIRFIDSFGSSDENFVKVYQKVQQLDKENELNHYIHEFDDSIKNFKVIGDKPQCKTNGKYQDINEFGEGLKTYISIICSLYACEDGYLFIDEIDNGIYYEHFDRLWEIILTLSKQTNCQVFATTHSREMLESFARIAKKLDEQDISYTLLVKNKKQEIKTISLGYKDIIDSVIEQGHEVR